MAMTEMGLNHYDGFASAVEQTLMDNVRAALKEKAMKIAEEEVDKAVDDALKDLNLRSEAFRDVFGHELKVKFLLSRFPKKEV